MEIFSPTDFDTLLLLIGFSKEHKKFHNPLKKAEATGALPSSEFDTSLSPTGSQI